MTMRKTRYTIAALAIGGFSTAAALFGSGAASAALTDDLAPLLTTKCSYSQFDAAIRNMAPTVAAKFDADPIQKVVLQKTLEQPLAQREATYRMITESFGPMEAMTRTDTTANTDMSANANADTRAAIRQAAATCHTF